MDPTTKNNDLDLGLTKSLPTKEISLRCVFEDTFLYKVRRRSLNEFQ